MILEKPMCRAGIERHRCRDWTYEPQREKESGMEKAEHTIMYFMTGESKVNTENNNHVLHRTV